MNSFRSFYPKLALMCFIVFASQIGQAGTVIAWGQNTYGESAVPFGLSNVIAIAGGGWHSLALKADGTVVGWGRNDWGQTSVPDGLTNVIAIDAGQYHSIALRRDGTLLVWGAGLSGLKNTQFFSRPVSAVAANGNDCLVLQSDGKMVAWGQYNDGQTIIPFGFSNAVAIAVSAHHNLALRPNGTIAAWGSTSVNQSNVMATLTNVVAIAGGGGHSLAIKSDGNVVAWGLTAYGQCDVPPGLTDVVAVSGGDNHSLALKSDGSVVAWGQNGWGQTNVPAGLTGVVAVAAGAYHSLALVDSSYPFIVRQPAGVNVFSGQPLWLSISALSSQQLSFQWRFNGNEIFGATNSALYLSAVQATNAGQYSVIVRNALGSIISSNAIVGAIDKAPFILTHPASQVILSSSPAVFTVIADGSAPIKYQWLKDNILIEGETNSTATFSNLRRVDSSAFSVIVTNQFGASTSSFANLRIISPLLLMPPAVAPIRQVTFLAVDPDGVELTTDDLLHSEALFSTNLSTWRIATNALVLTNGMLLFRKTNSTHVVREFYRIVEKP